MRINRGDLEGLRSRVPPPPPSIQPRLAVRDELAMLTGRRPDDGTLAARRRRVERLLERADTPRGEDAELVALLAEAGALPLVEKEDRMRARQRLGGIGADRDPPGEVARLFERLGLMPGEGSAFAEALLPSRHDGGSFDPGPTFLGA